MAEINNFINYVELPNGDARGIQTYHDLTIGDSVFNGSNPVTITAANLGLSQALKFVGSTNIEMTEETAQTIQLSNGSSHLASIGDVVLSNGNGEFVWLGNNWEQLGSEESYALKTVNILAGTGLNGGGDLASNRTLSINYAGGNPKMDGSVGAGSSDYPARADHVHPSDTSKFNINGGTITGATTINNTLTVSNTATFSNKTKIGGRLVLTTNAYGSSLPSGSFDTGTIFFKLV